MITCTVTVTKGGKTAVYQATAPTVCEAAIIARGFFGLEAKISARQLQ